MIPRTDILITFRSAAPYRVEDYLRKLVDSVVKNTPSYGRFIFVDDQSDAIGRDFIERVADEFPTSILIRTHAQHWFTRATNLGLKVSRTERVVALNCDTVCGEGWLEELYDVWDEANKQTGKKVGLVGSTWSREESRRWAPTTYPAYVTGHCYLAGLQALNDAANSRGTPGRFLDETSLQNAHIRSDIEICGRLNLLGYLTVSSFKSEVEHFGGKSWGYDLTAVNSITPQYLAMLDGK